MNSWHRLKKESRISIIDSEKQSCFQDDGGDSGEKMTNINPMWEPILKYWLAMFVLFGVITVLCVDPLFFYLPVINENGHCIELDNRLQITAICLRSVFDVIYVANMIFGFLFPRKSSNLVEDRATPEFKKMCFRYLGFVIDILAILPIPQVLVPIILKEMRSSKLLYARNILKALVLLQYVPRVVRIYLSWTKLIQSSKKIARRIWIQAAFNFFVYILASYVFGAFWYFLSIERQTTCWDKACAVDHACIPSSFRCGGKLQNNTFFDDFCRVQTSNTTQFDFGIFREAVESGIVSSTYIPQKIMYCFWWGLRNLSSLGQNLETSNFLGENFFSIFILIFGLLLVLYFIGSVQTYIQMITEKATKKVQMEAEKLEEIDRQMTIKKLTIRLWISRNQIPDSMKEQIFSCIKQTLERNKDFDTEKPIHHLSDKDLLKEIKLHLCLPLLRKVQGLKNEKEYLLRSICESLKPLYYNEDNYIIREGEPLNAMLFITQGSVWCFKTSNRENGEGPQCIEKGEYYGEELLEWGFNGSPSPKLSDYPISTKTVKTFTKVEAFALTANDLKILVARHSDALSNAKTKFTQAARRRLKEKKNENSTAQQ